MTWFAKRPTAQAKAATICSLLPWPETEAEQKRLQALVQEAMTGRYSAGAEIRAEIQKAHAGSGSVSTLDPFSGRGMIPLETSRLGLPAHAIDYSPVAVMASRLLTDYPARNWDNEPRLTYQHEESALLDHRPRLVQDVDLVLSEIRRRHQQAMSPYFHDVDGRQPWGHLWAVTLPCHECGRHFPLIGSLALRQTSTRKSKGKKGSFTDPGQSYYIEADAATDAHPPQRRGKRRPLLAADLDPDVGKHYRPLEPQERDAITEARATLATQPRFGVLLAARPDEPIPAGNTWTVQATVYGARTYGDMMNDRQTLSFITIAQIINSIANELKARGSSEDYIRALTGYAAAAMSRKLRRATRGSTLDSKLNKVNDLFATESSLNFSFDYFEVGLADGPGSWDSVAGGKP
jgi:adenine-specific DNA methylase